jgi:hypothetical protein
LEAIMTDAEAKRERIKEESISTADLASAPPAEKRRAEEAADRQDRPVGAIEVQKTQVSAQAIPVSSVAGATAAAPSQISAQTSTETDRGPLFSSEEAANLRSKWDAIQTGFVDEPRRSVQDADSLVAATMKRLAEQFAAERSALEAQWGRGSDVSTEDLRLALRRYRSFFGRLLSV